MQKCCIPGMDLCSRRSAKRNRNIMIIIVIIISDVLIEAFAGTCTIIMGCDAEKILEKYYRVHYNIIIYTYAQFETNIYCFNRCSVKRWRHELKTRLNYSV